MFGPIMGCGYPAVAWAPGDTLAACPLALGLCFYVNYISLLSRPAQMFFGQKAQTPRLRPKGECPPMLISIMPEWLLAQVCINQC